MSAAQDEAVGRGDLEPDASQPGFEVVHHAAWRRWGSAVPQRERTPVLLGAGVAAEETLAAPLGTFPILDARPDGVTLRGLCPAAVIGRPEGRVRPGFPERGICSRSCVESW